jgi:hypothetical protein
MVLQVWVVPETSEVFTSYEAYLARMDFYKQRRFICEITGHSGLNFFEAMRSEVCRCFRSVRFHREGQILNSTLDGGIARGEQQLPGSAQGANFASNSVLYGLKGR